MPRSASWKRPSRSVAAPVNEPLRCPKNSLSHISSGTDEQLTFTNGPDARRGDGVQASGQQLLAGARLPREQHDRIGGRRRLHHAEHAPPRCAVPHDALRRCGRGASQVADLAPESTGLERAVERHLEGIGVDRLEDVVARPRLQALDRRGHGAVAGEDDHRHVRRRRPHPPDELEAVGAGHAQVREHDVDGRPPEVGERVRHGSGRARVVAPRAQDLDERVPDVRLVLHHQHPAAADRSIAHRLKPPPRAPRCRPPAPPPAPRAAASGTPTRRPRAGARPVRPRAGARSYDRSTARGPSSPWSRRKARTPAAGPPRECRDRGPRSRRRHSDPPARDDPHLAPLRLHLARVHDQVHDDLAEHHGAAVDDERPRLEVEGEPEVGELVPRLDELLGLPQHLVEVERRARRLGRVGVREHLPHDARRAVEAALHRRHLPRGRLHVAAGERVAREREVVGHALERVVDLVGDAGGETADGREPLGVEELPLELAHARSLGGPRLEHGTAARLLQGESPEEKAERHHREVQAVRRPVARPHGLGETGDRALRLGARQRERPRPRPPVGADGGPGRDLARVGDGGAPRPRRVAAHHRPARVAQLAVAGRFSPDRPLVEEHRRLDLGLDRDAAGERPRRLAVRQPRGQAWARRVDGRTLAAGRARRDPQHRDAAAPADVDERAVVGRAHADAHDLGVAAQEEKESTSPPPGAGAGRRPCPSPPRRAARSSATRRGTRGRTGSRRAGARATSRARRCRGRSRGAPRRPRPGARRRCPTVRRR